MYRYDEFDARMVRDRVAEFSGQVARRVAGELTEDEFKPLRLMNGLYLQLHAYMLRVSIPYGTLSSRQMRMLAHVARKWDRGYGHFTTRQNIQFNWPRLPDVPAILDALAEVEMHAIQTSGNCIRNVTADHFAGAAADEVEDPRILSEIIRQWSTFHPEFSFLPRKFKIAVTGSPQDRAAIRVHDIGIACIRNAAGEAGYQVFAGGGQGRTPMLAHCVGDFVSREDILAFLEAVMRVYNEEGRRDNIYKARIKILVHQLGPDEMRRRVEAEFAEIRKAGSLQLPEAEYRRILDYFAPPSFAKLPAVSAAEEDAKRRNDAFAAFVKQNIFPHKVPGYASVSISLKPIGGIPGDADAAQMDAVADIAERHSFDEVRVTHEQNLVLPHVRRDELFAVWQALSAVGLATPNIGLVTDIIACPGLDYCDLANARSINIAQDISRRFADPARQLDLGELKIKISGCINACGHHHVGHIGILGVDKKGVEHYQISLGGSAAEDASLADIVGPAVPAESVADAIETIVAVYRAHREGRERLLDTYRRVGAQPFKERLHAAH